MWDDLLQPGGTLREQLAPGLRSDRPVHLQGPTLEEGSFTRNPSLSSSWGRGIIIILIFFYLTIIIFPELVVLNYFLQITYSPL